MQLFVCAINKHQLLTLHTLKGFKEIVDKSRIQNDNHGKTENISPIQNNTFDTISLEWF